MSEDYCEKCKYFKYCYDVEHQFLSGSDCPYFDFKLFDRMINEAKINA